MDTTTTPKARDPFFLKLRLYKLLKDLGLKAHLIMKHQIVTNVDKFTDGKVEYTVTKKY